MKKPVSQFTIFWKRYEECTVYQGWHNVAYPRHIGSFLYGLFFLVIGLPCLCSWLFKTPSMSTKKMDFSVKDLTGLGTVSFGEFQRKVLPLANKIKKNKQSQTDLLRYTIERSSSCLSAKKKIDFLLEDSALSPIFNRPHLRAEIEKLFWDRWEKDFLFKKNKAA